MVYVTGDTHGELDRFKSKPIAKQLKKGDYLIVCGDFGFYWNDSKRERKSRKWLSKQKYTILFVEGTHDNLDMIEKTPPVDWCGGKARKLENNIFQLCRGFVFKIDGNFIFAIGGGESTDMEERDALGVWWKQEMPSLQELTDAREKLKEYRDVVDFVISHECPAALVKNVEQEEGLLYVNYLNLFFDQIGKECRFKQWYFGCYHLDKKFPPNHTAIFQDVVALGGTPAKKGLRG